MPSRQWTQLNDPHSEPDGIQRIGYDADTAQYTFRHPNGALYQGSEYGGELTLVRDHIQRVEAERPEVFDVSGSCVLTLERVHPYDIPGYLTFLSHYCNIMPGGTLSRRRSQQT
ncbi:hypothetical protein DFP72DRAFT_1055891 [Ephemerocybe angulata]|uniref:Uncharacterized protein n=1 Tax=Ephemerocybe angulata TaxID=980116 RepID=A0A8H6H638_9AGAR|nr:hypothetical protein DFP72DRAFT_1055891 [Tulosesus angulatus]